MRREPLLILISATLLVLLGGWLWDRENEHSGNIGAYVTTDIGNESKPFIKRIIVNPWGDHNGTAMKDYSIQASHDNCNFKDIAKGTFKNFRGEETELSVRIDPPEKYRFWRLAIHNTYRLDRLAGVTEIKYLGIINGTNFALDLIPQTSETAHGSVRQIHDGFSANKDGSYNRWLSVIHSNTNNPHICSPINYFNRTAE